MILNQPIIAFIGGGNMASSLIGGLVDTGFPPARIRVSDPIADNRHKLEADFGVVTGADNKEICRDADVVVLAVKPQVLKSVAEGIANALKTQVVVVSIAAGIPVPALQKWLGRDRAIVRCMPNTPALVSRGAAGLYATEHVNAEQKDQVDAVFKAVGVTAWFASEEDLDAVTALSGSGPAYFFLMMESMEKAGVRLGLSEDTARLLCLQTALGAATMAINSDVDCAELRRRVTSPGGTTQQAIATFIDGRLPELVEQAMTSACQRAKEMADEYSK